MNDDFLNEKDEPSDTNGGGSGDLEDEEASREWEECVWRSDLISDEALLRYLGSVRSLAVFAGICTRGPVDEMYEVAQSDQTTIYAIDVLHQMNYDSSRALEYLGKHPIPPGFEGRNLNEEETVGCLFLFLFA